MSSGKRLFGRKAPAGPAGRDGRGSPISVQDFVKGAASEPASEAAGANGEAHPLAPIALQASTLTVNPRTRVPQLCRATMHRA